jgi:signal transduction histidine kinase
VNEPVAQLPVAGPHDVLALRQLGRVAAAELGCDEVHQVRLATALSEFGREALIHGASASAAFSLEGGGALSVVLESSHAASSLRTWSAAIDAARKLVADVTSHVDPASGSLTLTLRVGAPQAKRKATAASLRAALARTSGREPLDEVRLENRNLIATLDELSARQEELVRLNAELEETNRGVMAMYAQLADELEETNRGVVALYAELDDKSAQLNRASEAKSRFFASVSHELRSPLSSILGLAGLLLEDAGSSGTEQRTQLELIAASTRELLGLVNELLDVAKAESGRLAPEPACVELDGLFAELRGSLRPLARPGVAVEIEAPDGLSLETDRVLLAQVLRNLLGNALKFTPAGSVRLSAALVSPFELAITVSDTGIGIAPEHQARVFEEFFQVRGPLQADDKGTGLGLPYARRVAETLGGSLSLESELGAGSTFRLRLPLVWERALHDVKTSARRVPQPANVASILIVDDDAGFRAALRGLVQDFARHVSEARGGNEGLSLMRSSRPDVVFLDLRMPDLDGAAVLAEMTSDANLRDVPVVVVSSAELDELDRAAMRAAAGFLGKEQVTRDSVRDVLAGVLG